mgnify:FL=1
MKARLPKGLGGSMGGLQQLAQKAQKIQDEMQTATEKLNLKEYQATSGGGAVTVTLNGKLELTNINIKPEVVDPEDLEMLSDLIIAATNEAIRSANDEKQSVMDKLSEGLNVPGLF